MEKLPTIIMRECLAITGNLESEEENSKVKYLHQFSLKKEKYIYAFSGLVLWMNDRKYQNGLRSFMLKSLN